MATFFFRVYISAFDLDYNLVVFHKQNQPPGKEQIMVCNIIHVLYLIASESVLYHKSKNLFNQLSICVRKFER